MELSKKKVYSDERKKIKYHIKSKQYKYIFIKKNNLTIYKYNLTNKL